jgi:pyruvate dehydrogenase E1 component alpha subunit
MYDSDRYRDKAEIAAWKQHDPIEALLALMRAEHQVDDEALAGMEEDVAAVIEHAIEVAEAAPIEPVEELTRFVTSEVQEAGR